MEAVKNFFQNASNACAYANECAPDFSFLKPHEPYTALVAVAVGCYIFWAWNERRIARRKTQGADTRDLTQMFRAMKSQPAPAKKLAA